jgi:hypothetical protein
MESWTCELNIQLWIGYLTLTNTAFRLEVLQIHIKCEQILYMGICFLIDHVS